MVEKALTRLRNGFIKSVVLFLYPRNEVWGGI